MAQTITILHGYRNEVYHSGLKHEAILPSLSVFYFDVVCDYLSGYRPRGLGWGSNRKTVLNGPKSIFTATRCFLAASTTSRMAVRRYAKPATTTRFARSPRLLTRWIVSSGHRLFTFNLIAGGVYKGQETTRDKAVVDTQAWSLAFSEEGKAFAFAHGWYGNMLQLVEWLAENYPHKFRSDPIASWQAQTGRLRGNKNPHVTLSNYQSFMASTADIREALEDPLLP